MSDHTDGFEEMADAIADGRRCVRRDAKVERAARGFHRAMVGLSYDGKPWEELSEGERERCREIVRASASEESGPEREPSNEELARRLRTAAHDREHVLLANDRKTMRLAAARLRASGSPGPEGGPLDSTAEDSPGTFGAHWICGQVRDALGLPDRATAREYLDAIQALKAASPSVEAREALQRVRHKLAVAGRASEDPAALDAIQAAMEEIDRALATHEGSTDE